VSIKILVVDDEEITVEEALGRLKLDTQGNKVPNFNVVNKHKLLGISSLFMF
jgi:hypothetical protein